jgi:hypothetical protein
MDEQPLEMGAEYPERFPTNIVDVKNGSERGTSWSPNREVKTEGVRIDVFPWRRTVVNVVGTAV